MGQGLAITTYWNVNQIPANLEPGTHRDRIDRTDLCPISRFPIHNGAPVAVHEGAVGSDRYHLEDLRKWFNHCDEQGLPYNCPSCRQLLDPSGLDRPPVQPTSIKVRNFCTQMLASFVAVCGIPGAALGTNFTLADPLLDKAARRIGTTYLTGLVTTLGIVCFATACVDHEENYEGQALLKPALGVTCCALAVYIWQNMRPFLHTY